MDSLTQIVLGASVGEAVLGKRIGNKALLLGAIGGTIPDLDVFAANFTDTVTGIELHRGFSHSILFALLAGPVLGYISKKLDKKGKATFFQWSMLFFMTIVTHPMLDAFTTWGTQFFWPSDLRIAFNSVFVIDPFYTLPFLVGLLVLLKWSRTSKKRRVLNYTLIGLSTSYLILGVFVKIYQQNLFENDLIQSGISYKRISTRPAPFSIFLWNANVELDSGYMLGYHSIFSERIVWEKTVPKNRNRVSKISNHPKVQRLITIANGWYVLEEVKTGWAFYDLRFGVIPNLNGGSDFVFTYLLSQDPETRQVSVEQKQNKPDNVRFILRSLLRRIAGKD